MKNIERSVHSVKHVMHFNKESQHWDRKKSCLVFHVPALYKSTR